MSELKVDLDRITEMVDHIRDVYNKRGTLEATMDFDHSQVLMLVEEAGEFAAAYRRWIGWARRSGTFPEARAELADVVIAACAVADSLCIDIDAAVNEKLEKIFSRGWSE